MEVWFERGQAEARRAAAEVLYFDLVREPRVAEGGLWSKVATRDLRVRVGSLFSALDHRHLAIAGAYR